jgi:hypothetical protein
MNKRCIVYMVVADAVAENVGHKYWFRRSILGDQWQRYEHRNPYINVRCSNLVIVEHADGIDIIKDRQGRQTIDQEEFLWIKLSSIELTD